MGWTPEQEKVINLRNCNILVSAAAGSGKTAVLVERIIRRVTEKEHPLDVDRLLVVTFTEAAAAEMKDRIQKAILNELEKNPDDEHLLRQQVLIHSARITTIHSFCLSVIRDYFHTIDLDPGFKIAEEGEQKLLRQEAIEELLEDYYAAGDPAFLALSEMMSSGRDDRELEKAVLRLYEYAGSFPNPKRWLQDAAAEYSRDSRVFEAVFRYAMGTLAELPEIMETAAELAGRDDGPNSYLPAIGADMERVAEYLKASDYRGLSDAFDRAPAWAGLTACRKKDVDKNLVERVKGMRAAWKKSVEDLEKLFFFQSADEMEADMEACRVPAEMLAQLVSEFEDRFRAKKEEKNLIDFHDMEQMALAILAREEDGILVPTDAAKDYREQFEEVMVDEYQDSNFLQEAILTSVTRMSKGQYNYFMVGDVKQSIYRFRLSRPELFMDKYEKYGEDGERVRIDLHKNFRSRAEVLEGANLVFRKIMKRRLGRVEYDDNAALYVGATVYPETDACRCEALVVEGSDRETEAQAVAMRIHELMRDGKVLDPETKEERRIRYGDIVILLRSLAGWSDEYVRVLNREGIPAHADQREGYFKTLETTWLLDYLKVLDNPRQDIPLTSAFMGPFGGFSAEEMAQIRNTGDGSFYLRVMAAAECACGIPEELREKTAAMMRQIEHFREMIPYTETEELIRKVVTETGFLGYITAMPGGEQRRANVEMLLQKARAYEKTSFKGLFQFVRYVEQLQKYKVDFGEASLPGEASNTVRIMSIHKSKGLEFPVVIVAGMGKPFNSQDQKAKMVIHPELGVGLEAIDIVRRTKTNTILKQFAKTEEKMQSLGEEIRILYVALTRAKEKLILAGGVKKEKELFGDEPSFLELFSADNYYAWVLPVIAGSDLFDIRYISEEGILTEAETRRLGSDLSRRALLEMIADETKERAVCDSAYREELESQMRYIYPYAGEAAMKLKFSVSELKLRHIDEQGETVEMFPQSGKPDKTLPKFLAGDEKMSGALRGTAYHKVMELLDFSKSYDKAGIQSELHGFAEAGLMTKDAVDCVRAEDVLAFLASPVGKRMAEAQRLGKLRKEQPFVYETGASVAYEDAGDDEKVLIQGIIDAVFEEDAQMVIVDYKTDRVADRKELIDRYETQLRLYEEAVTRLTGVAVKECRIYSFCLREDFKI